jgi:tetratricopeptide (TPR) repeat protein
MIGETLENSFQAGSIGLVEAESRSVGSSRQDISDWSKRGYQLLKENRVGEAEEYFYNILAADEFNNYALVGLGDAARKRGAHREAVHFYARCLEHHPGNNYALFGLADCYKSLNQFHRAIEIWEQYLCHDDSNVTVLTRVADAYRKIRDFKHSKEVYLRVIGMEENNHYAIIGLGHLHYDFREYRDALFYWEKMIELDRENVDIRVLTSIGNCHRRLKTFEEGITFFEKALSRDPGNFYALFGLADCYRGLNQPEKSVAFWNRILDRDPRNKVILTRAGDAYRSMGDYPKAVEYFRRALNVEYDPYAVLGLAVVAKSQNRYGEAIESLRSLIRQDPRNYRLYMELSDCWYRKGDKKTAIETLGEFQKLGGRHAKVAELLDRYRN